MMKYLDLYHKYFNFYITVLSTILAATVTGIFNSSSAGYRGLLLLIGPILIVPLACLGYNTIRVFFTRHLEAWLTTLNIDAMLGLRSDLVIGDGLDPVRFRSKLNRGFITDFERSEVRHILDEATQGNLASEEALDRILRIADTLSYARWTFSLYAVAATVSAIAILAVVF